MFWIVTVRSSSLTFKPCEGSDAVPRCLALLSSTSSHVQHKVNINNKYFLNELSSLNFSLHIITPEEEILVSSAPHPHPALW